MLKIVVIIHDITGKATTDPIMVEAFEHNFFDSIFPRHIASPVTLDKDGWFKIHPHYYLVWMLIKLPNYHRSIKEIRIGKRRTTTKRVFPRYRFPWK